MVSSDRSSAVHARGRVGGIRLLLASLALAWCAGTAAADDLFRLQAQTRIKVMVVEWLAAAGEYKEWTALDGEYFVSQGGTISVPLIGELAAAGRTPAELASEIARQLKDRTGLTTAPATTVEVVRYPSVYVTGTVDRPGEFEYRPDLTVLQALAMAGGRARRSDPLGGYSQIEQIRYVGELRRIDLEYKRMLARRARLEAELADKSSIAFPPQLTDAQSDMQAARVMREEDRVFHARTEAYRRQLDSLKELGALFSKEIVVLDEKMAAQDRQVKVTQEELDGVSRLVNSGTATKSRQTSLERILAELQSDRLDVAIASMRAKQKVSETERDALNLEGQRKTEIGRELQATQSEMDNLNVNRATNEQVLDAMGASLERRDGQLAMETQPLKFAIARGGRGVPVAAEATSLLLPGDVLEVRYDLAPADDEQATGSIELGMRE